MGRKIVQQGPTTLMVSLPIKWARKFNLEKGNELDLEEKGNKLVFSTKTKIREEKAEITIDSTDRLYIWRILQPLYIFGYDDIKIHFSSPKTLDILQEFVISSLIGFELITHEKDYCVIKAVSTELQEQFPSILRRVFLNLLRMSEITLAFLKNHEDPSLILNMELMNNRHTMFLKRLTVKEGYEDTKKSPMMYSLAIYLEEIANEFKYFTWYVQKNQIKVSKEMISYYEKLDAQINHVYHAFYSYDEEKIKEIILKDIRVEQIKPLFKQDPEIAYYCMKITGLMRNMLQQIMGLKI